jgi:hypothetical protein
VGDGGGGCAGRCARAARRARQGNDAAEQHRPEQPRTQARLARFVFGGAGGGSVDLELAQGGMAEARARSSSCGTTALTGSAPAGASRDPASRRNGGSPCAAKTIDASAHGRRDERRSGRARGALVGTMRRNAPRRQRDRRRLAMSLPRSRR